MFLFEQEGCDFKCMTWVRVSSLPIEQDHYQYGTKTNVLSTPSHQQDGFKPDIGKRSPSAFW